MNVSLTPELEALIEKRVRQGLHQTASEVVRESLRFFFKHEAEFDRQQKLRFVVTSKEDLAAKLLEGIEQLDRGEGIPGDHVFAELKARSTSRRRRNA
jgi:antitoxin ParD1/3/4